MLYSQSLDTYTDAQKMVIKPLAVFNFGEKIQLEPGLFICSILICTLTVRQVSTSALLQIEKLYFAIENVHSNTVQKDRQKTREMCISGCSDVFSSTNIHALIRL